MLSEKTRLQFYLYLNGELPIEEFEQWIYSTDELEMQLLPRDYLDLIAFDFNKKGASYNLKLVVEKHINQTNFDTWRIKKLLTDLITEERDTVEVSECLYDLYCSGYWFLREVGMPYVYGIDDIPRLSEKHLWNEQAFYEKRQILSNYLKDLKPEAQRLLVDIKEGKIEIIPLEIK